MLKEVVGYKIDVLLISETKLDDTFPLNQFILKGFTPPYRIDRTAHAGDLMLFVREDIPSKLLTNINPSCDIENIFFEINLRSKKWLISGSYNPNVSHIQNHTVNFSKNLDFYSSKYENFIVIGDFNAEMTNNYLEEFCASYNLKNLIKEPTCFKNIDNPTLIDPILINHTKSFHSSGLYERGLSDFDKLTLTVLKTFHVKHKPKIIQYRDFNHFDNTSFRADLLQELSLKNVLPGEFENFKYISSKVLNIHAPIKEKHVRCNQSPFMSKQLRKAIMTRTRLLNKYRKYNSAENLFAYKRQRNLCVKLLRKSKKDFYNNLNVKRITDNRKFWQTIKPHFTDKTLRDERITLVEGDKIITEEKHVVKKFKDHFEKIDRPKLSDLSNDLFLNAIENFFRHASALKIKEARDSTDCFSFKLVSIEDICKEIRALDASKATQSDDIPTKIIKNNSDIFSKIFQANLNNAIETSTFPEQLKYADVKSVFKKDSRTDKNNYRPISILPNISKIYERCINKQLEGYFQGLLSKYQCGSRKGYNVINTLLPMIEKWRKFLDAGGAFGALLTDLSKALDCLPNELLIAKLHAYGVNVLPLKLLHSYLTKRKQRVKLNGTHSSWSEILFGVPQGCILGPLLFNIFLCDLFQFSPDLDIANYADDNIPHSSNINLNKVLYDLEKISDTLFK